MKGMIPVPTGLSLPNDAEVKPFSLTGMFILRGDKLMALELGGKAVPCGEEEEEEGEEKEGEEEGCCGAYKNGEMCENCPKQGGGFLVAIERAMKPTKRS